MNWRGQETHPGTSYEGHEALDGVGGGGGGGEIPFPSPHFDKNKILVPLESFLRNANRGTQREYSSKQLKHSNVKLSYNLLFLGHRSLIKKITQTAVINIVFQRIFIKLDVSYASQHTFSKVTVTIFKNYIYIVNNRGLEPTILDIFSWNT